MAWFVVFGIGSSIARAEPRTDGASARPSELAPLELPVRPHPRRLDLGVRGLVVSRFAEGEIDGVPTRARHEATPGVGVNVRVPVLGMLDLVGAWGLSTVHLGLEPGAPGTSRIGASPAGLDAPIGGLAWWMQARVEPTFDLGHDVVLRGIAGVGWGRIELDPSHARDAAGRFLVRDRSASIVEFPLGAGVSVELVEGWLKLEAELLVSPTLTTDGTAHVPVGVVAGDGSAGRVDALPRAPVSLQQAVGLAVQL
jgi:hypothetical protein